jgi:hypothetical protein
MPRVEPREELLSSTHRPCRIELYPSHDSDGQRLSAPCPPVTKGWALRKPAVKKQRMISVEVCHGSPDSAASASPLKISQPQVRYIGLTNPHGRVRRLPTYWLAGRFTQFRREALALLSPGRRWSVLLLVAPGSTCAAQSLLPALPPTTASAPPVCSGPSRWSCAGIGSALQRADPRRLGPPPHLRGCGTDRRFRRHVVAYRESPIGLLLGNASLPADYVLV